MKEIIGSLELFRMYAQVTEGFIDNIDGTQLPP
jgi:hypothetical protein